MSHRFRTTRWSLVLAAGGDQSSAAHAAIATLCELYWYPIYAYVRRQGYQPDHAQDLTQAFFTQLLERRDLQGLRRERGRLRSYLLGAVRHFLMNQETRKGAQKRGGGQPELSLEFEMAEARYALEPVDSLTPEKIYERRWALTVLDQVLQELRRDSEEAGRTRQFEVLKDALLGDLPADGYASVANDLGITVNNATVTVHRLRRDFRRRLREVIADTVLSEEAVDDELSHLFAALRS